MKKLSHVDARGEARMVGVGGKPVVERLASATATLHCAAGTIRLLKARALPKGDVLAVARIAGIQAVKQTSALIPLCHPLPIEGIAVEFRVLARSVRACCSVTTHARTGVEMEALTGAVTAALALYDMCKAVDKSMTIGDVRVLEKRKGASAV